MPELILAQPAVPLQSYYLHKRLVYGEKLNPTQPTSNNYNSKTSKTISFFALLDADSPVKIPINAVAIRMAVYITNLQGHNSLIAIEFQNKYIHLLIGQIVRRHVQRSIHSVDGAQSP